MKVTKADTELVSIMMHALVDFQLKIIPKMIMHDKKYSKWENNLKCLWSDVMYGRFLPNAILVEIFRKSRNFTWA